MIFRKKRTTQENTRHTGEVFSSCTELPLEHFIRVMVHKDLNALIKSGTVDMATLTAAWEQIQIEYIEATSSKEERAQLMEEVQCAYEESKINRCRMMAAFLWENADETIAEQLRIEDFDVPEMTVPDAERHAALQIVINILSGDELRLDMIRRESGSSGKTEITEVWFYDVLNAASQVVGHAIPETITTLRFCRYYLQLKEAARPKSSSRSKAEIQ